MIPNAVDTSFPRKTANDIQAMRASMKLTDATLNAVCVARQHHQKGIDVLLRGLTLLNDTARRRLSVSLIGDGPDRADLEGLAGDLGLGDTVRFLGWHDDPRRILEAFDLFLLPSRSEGQPIALLEAMAAGLPVIATRIAGTEEALLGGRLGELVPSERPEALAEAVARFIADPAPLRQKAAGGPEHIRHHHGIEAAMKRTIALWRE
ncbi:MAG: glycosyltransferase [Deltaproteobacteria bacterium]|nr:glycosyltransferase [Deltaproteobacteria bacterium]